MDQDYNKLAKRRNKFTGKEDISREAVDAIIAGQIDQLREISRANDDAISKIRESVNVLYERRISVDTAKFEQLSHGFIEKMEDKLRRVKQPSKGLKWYVAMWVITLVSAFFAGYFIYERQEWREEAMYWYQQYEGIKSKK